MNRAFSKLFEHPSLVVFLTVVLKLPLFFTRNIQEDAFITWRVARNLLNFGVIGFNGGERISASTTHLYVLVSAFFQWIFGENFIPPLLVFNGILFAVGSFWFAQILFPEDVFKRGIFAIFLNMLPPAITASGLGMEYGLVFFLYCGLLYFGIFKRKNWAYFLFPILLLWTRIDTVIFLGVFFLADLVIRKKLNYLFILGGILGTVSVVSFNYFYFGELVNHTITAKKIAYKNLLLDSSCTHFIYQWAYYGGLIKKYSLFTVLIFLLFLGTVGFWVVQIFKNKIQIPFSTKVILISTVVFALLKITIFAFFKAYFDWYYWLPRVFLLAVLLYSALQFLPLKRKILLPVLLTVTFVLYFFQMMQSYAIGYMESRQRMQIAADINKDEVSLQQSILLEPAGIIPFYTNLYTFDEVGLVDKRINDEMLKDEHFWWINSVEKFKPNYILTIAKKPGDAGTFYNVTQENLIYFNRNYRLVKKYPIVKIHENAPQILRWIYKIRPIGKDYFLYKKVH